MDYHLPYLGPVFNTLGLGLDIVGVCVLSRAVIFNKKTAAKLAGTYWNLNPHLEKALLRQSRDAMMGLCLVITGFVMQIFGTWLSLPT